MICLTILNKSVCNCISVVILVVIPLSNKCPITINCFVFTSITLEFNYFMPTTINRTSFQATIKLCVHDSFELPARRFFVVGINAGINGHKHFVIHSFSEPYFIKFVCWDCCVIYYSLHSSTKKRMSYYHFLTSVTYLFDYHLHPIFCYFDIEIEWLLP